MEERGGHYEVIFAIEPTLVDFTEPVSQLNQAVSQALGEVEAASVAVHIIAYEQTIPIFEKAAAHPALSQVTWIGNDGFTGNSDLLNHPAAADFAVQTQFVSPVYQLDFDPNASVETLNYRLQQKLGYLPDPITLQSYDAVWLAALALIQQQRENTPDIQDALVAILPWYRGYTQVIRFNANGDRYTGMYVFKTVEPAQTSYRWQKDCAFVFITQDPSDTSQDPNTNPIDGLPVKHRILITRRPVIPMEETFPLPVLVPITGEISTLRLPILRALQTVETDLNRYLAMYGSPSTVQVEIFDSESNATTSLNHVVQIAAQKSSPIIIGPYSSEALRGVKDFADSHGLILLSPGSTAVSLSIANDSIYRLVLDDAKQAAALARYMAEEAIQTVIPVWIDNEYGNSYHSALIQEMKNAGKTISDGISYPPGQTNFTETLLAIDQQIHAAMQNQAPHSIGVVLIGYDEGIGLLASAEEQSRLAQVRWFGSDSYAYSTAIQDNPQAWAFALQTQFTAAYFAPEQDLYVWSIARGRLVKSYFENFLTRFQQDYQARPGNFTYTTYDAAWLTAMTNFQISPTDTLDTVKRIMSSTFNLSPGYNERNQFSPTGDKAYGTIGFAHVTEVRGWDTPAAYHFSSDLPSWLEYYNTQPTSTAGGWELYP
jgi:ABC-type branched-subunit amino acid transport system substrate-binding protein